MKKLILYISISDQLINFPPPWLHAYARDEVHISEIDSRSEREVIQVTTEALNLAEKVVVCVNIDDPNANIDRLFPVFRKISEKKNQSIWVQNGVHESLGIFRKRMPLLIDAKSHEHVREQIENFIN